MSGQRSFVAATKRFRRAGRGGGGAIHPILSGYKSDPCNFDHREVFYLMTAVTIEHPPRM
jgi:hypothetical protein